MEHLAVESDCEFLASRAWSAPHHRVGGLAEAGNTFVAARAGLTVAV
jgi:hypothetical protein